MTYPGQKVTGEVLLDGQNILFPQEDLNRLRSKVGMVFQKPTPFPMSIYDNVAFGIRLHEKLSTSEMDRRVEAALRQAVAAAPASADASNVKADLGAVAR